MDSVETEAASTIFSLPVAPVVVPVQFPSLPVFHIRASFVLTEERIIIVADNGEQSSTGTHVELPAADGYDQGLSHFKHGRIKSECLLKKRELVEMSLFHFGCDFSENG